MFPTSARAAMGAGATPRPAGLASTFSSFPRSDDGRPGPGRLAGPARAGPPHAERHDRPPGRARRRRRTGLAADAAGSPSGAAHAPAARPDRPGDAVRGVPGPGGALRAGQHPPALHGLGAWRRHRHRHAGRAAGGRAERQPRRPRPRADRAGAHRDRLGGRDDGPAGRELRPPGHRLVHGQHDRRAGRETSRRRTRGTRRRGRRPRPGRLCRRQRARLHPARLRPGRPRHRRPAHGRAGRRRAHGPDSPGRGRWRGTVPPA